jgi:hypothetical protein
MMYSIETVFDLDSKQNTILWIRTSSYFRLERAVKINKPFPNRLSKRSCYQILEAMNPIILQFRKVRFTDRAKITVIV